MKNIKIFNNKLIQAKKYVKITRKKNLSFKNL